MSGTTVLAYHPLFDGRGFSPVQASWGRYHTFRSLSDSLGLSGTVPRVVATPARPEDVLAVHTADYDDFVQQCDRASGFCIFNDVAAAALHLRHGGLTRIAIVDVDGHHGDGTQELLYDLPLLTISLHQFDGRFFPGTGDAGEVG